MNRFNAETLYHQVREAICTIPVLASEALRGRDSEDNAYLFFENIVATSAAAARKLLALEDGPPDQLDPTIEALAAINSLAVLLYQDGGGFGPWDEEWVERMSVPVAERTCALDTLARAMWVPFSAQTPPQEWLAQFPERAPEAV